MIGCKVYFTGLKPNCFGNNKHMLAWKDYTLTTLTKEKIDFIFNLKLSMKQSLLSTVNISYIVEILCALS